MRRIEFTLRKDLKSSVHALSFVEFPAIDEELTYLSKYAEPVMLSLDEEKGIVYTPVLIPDKDILRKDSKGETYNMYFSGETVRQAAYDFISSGGDLVTEFNYEHDPTQKLSDVKVIESWVIDDPKDGKAAKFGFSHLPVDTWMVGIKVDNEQVRKAIKDKKIKGISLEGYFDNAFEEKLTNINKLQMSEKKELLGTFLDRLLGKTTLSAEGVDAPVETPSTPEAKLAEIDDGVYPLGDGRAIVVKDGMIMEVREMEEELEDKKEEMEDKETMSEVEKLAEATTKAIENQSKEIASIKQTLSKIEDSALVKLAAEGGSQPNAEKLHILEKFKLV